MNNLEVCIFRGDADQRLRRLGVGESKALEVREGCGLKAMFAWMDDVLVLYIYRTVFVDMAHIDSFVTMM